MFTIMITLTNDYDDADIDGRTVDPAMKPMDAMMPMTEAARLSDPITWR